MMKRTTINRTNRYYSIMVSTVILVLTATTLSAQSDQNLKKSIQELNNKFISVFQGGDAGKLTEFYASDGQLLPTGSPAIIGVDHILGFWQAGMNAGINNVVLQTLEAEKFGDKVIEQGAYKILAGGDFTIDQGKYIVIWKDEGGKLKIYRDIWNSSNPPPPSRANENDTILLIFDYVKADMIEEYSNFNTNILKPVSVEYGTSNSVRTLQKLNKNEDGTSTCIYLVDPSTSTVNYGMLESLVNYYGEEKGKKYFEIYKSCLEKKSSGRFVVTSLW
jgi:ketosteroid isomerase-like protein